MTRFLHVTDLHVSAPGTDDPGRQTDTAATFRRLVQIANDLRPRPAFIVASGDLTNIGDEASYRWLAETASALAMPVVWGLGNHDRRAGFHTAFPGLPGAPDGPLDHDAEIAGVHVIALDSSVPGRVSGDLDAAQLGRLTDMLGRAPDLPKILAIHHPPRIVPGAGYGWATLSETATAALADAIAGANVTAILSGHVHMNRVGHWQGVPLVITMGQQSTVDLARSDGGLSVIEGTGFAICDLLPEAGLQVTYVPLTATRLIKEIPPERLQAFS